MDNILSECRRVATVPIKGNVIRILGSAISREVRELNNSILFHEEHELPESEYLVARFIADRKELEKFYKMLMDENDRLITEEGRQPCAR